MEPIELKPGQYQCCICGAIYEKEWTDEEAAAERKENFGTDHAPDDGIACDDCYRRFVGEHFN